ncbi:MAG TPA: UDP-N-acetylglucosamine 1-carboxyvinyltransferase [Candidatus Dormibacteraeota bacterium]|nr:UDP-N-acetylglucosamine 1-carboxyvinyltransferase [Candidatus Dormibacteraeota bacterium]
MSEVAPPAARTPKPHLEITGRTPLQGRVTVSGSKNAALPQMAAAILAEGPLRLSNVPAIEDVETMCRLLRGLGARVERSGAQVEIDARSVSKGEPDVDLGRRMRASLLLLGPLLAAHGEASLPLPGGDDIGLRRVEQHLDGLRAMGAEVTEDEFGIRARATHLHGAHIQLDMPTVTGTENLMMAAARADGITVISNAAREPHVVDLALCLKAMGARIAGAGGDRIVIEGVARLHPTGHRVRADYIEAGTFAMAAAATGGDVLIDQLDCDDLDQVLHKLRRAGCQVEEGGTWLRVCRSGNLSAVDMTTWPHPGFATDLQSQFVAMMTQAEGVSTVSEALFENRFQHVEQLRRLGAVITLHGRSAMVRGGVPLVAAELSISDIRSGAALVIAALCADGTTQLNNVHHLDRGYENLVGKLTGLGASLRLDLPAGTD